MLNGVQQGLIVIEHSYNKVELKNFGCCFTRLSAAALLNAKQMS